MATRVPGTTTRGNGKLPAVETWIITTSCPGSPMAKSRERDPEGGEKLFHRILGGVDGDDRSGCFRCTPVAAENVHVSVSFLSRLSASGDLRIAWWGRSAAGVDSGDHESSPSICRWWVSVSFSAST